MGLFTSLHCMLFRETIDNVIKKTIEIKTIEIKVQIIVILVIIPYNNVIISY